MTSAGGVLSATDGSFAAGTLTLSGDLATVNADLATLTDFEPGAGHVPLVIGAVDSFGNVAAAQTIDVNVQRLAPKLQGGGTVGATAFGAAVAVAPGIDLAIDQTGSLFSASIAITGGLRPGDLLSDDDPNIGAIYDQATGTLTLTGIYYVSTTDWDYALRSVQFSTTSTSTATRKLSWIVNDGTLDSPVYKTTIDVASPISGKTYTLTPGVDSVRGGAGVNAFLAADGALSGGDVIRGRGQDYLVLQGAGTFDMRAPTTLRGIGTVYAFDNLAAGPETLYTRAGQSVTIDVVSGSVFGLPVPITIYGNADADSFNLHGGDLVYVGSNNEVFSGGDFNTFVVTAQTSRATIFGGYSMNNTMLVEGGGAVTLDPLSGFSQVTLEARTNLTTSLASGVSTQPTITATTGGNTVTFLTGGQTFVGVAGHDVINFYAFDGDTVQGTAAAVNGDVLHEFAKYPDTSDTLTVTDLDPNTTAFIAIRESTAGAVLTLGDGVQTTTVKVTVGPVDDGLPPGSFVLSGNSVSFSSSAALVIPSTPFTFVGYGAAVSQSLEADGPLNSADSLIGAAGATNSLNLLGGGTFDLSALKALSDFGVINVSEALGGTRLVLRSGLNASVDVFNQTGVAGASINVIGAVGDSSTITLGDGTDTVVVRSATETVIGGSGADTYLITASTAGATITGGAGSNTLRIAGGGSVALGDSITGMQTVRLIQPTDLSLNSMQFVRAIGRGGADTLTAGGVNQTLTGGGGGDVLIGSPLGSDTFLDRSANLDGATIDGLVASDLIDITDLKFATANLTQTANGGGGTILSFTDGVHSAAIVLDVAPTSTFTLASDGLKGTLIQLA